MSAKVITFCNKDFLRLAALWAEGVQRLGIDNYLIIATDTAACDKLKQWGIATRLFDLDGTGSKSVTGPYRMNIVRQYLADGTDVVLTDLDIVWKKNILTEYEGRTEADIYASQDYFRTARRAPGTSLRSAMRRFRRSSGIIMCCGFLYIRSTSSVLRFFDAYVRQLSRTGSVQDQPTFNSILANTRWNIVTANAVQARHLWFQTACRCFKSDITGYNEEFDLKLCLISMFKVQRGYLDDSGYLYHYTFTALDREKLRPLTARSFARCLPAGLSVHHRIPTRYRLTGWLICKAPDIYDSLVKYCRYISLHRFTRVIQETMLRLLRGRAPHVRLRIHSPVFAHVQRAIDATFREHIIYLHQELKMCRTNVGMILSQDEFVAATSFFFFHSRRFCFSDIKAKDIRNIQTARLPIALRKICIYFGYASKENYPYLILALRRYLNSIQIAMKERSAK